MIWNSAGLIQCNCMSQLLELFPLKRCIPPANGHGKMKKNDTMNGNHNPEPMISVTTSFTNYANFVICTGTKKIDNFVNFSQKLPLISNMLYSPLKTVIPEREGRVELTHILPYGLLHQLDVQLCLVCPWCAFLQCTEGGSNVIQESFQFGTRLFPCHVAYYGIRRTNFLCKHHDCHEHFRLSFHRNYM